MNNFPFEKGIWTREPKIYAMTEGGMTITTEPHTDLWQRTYYGFRNDSAPVFQIKTREKYFSFSVRTLFIGRRRFDQCGIALYLDPENWLKASIECENDEYKRLGSVVTNGGWSDWATTDIPASVCEMYYRLSRRESDYLIERSSDGREYKQMRICHLAAGGGEIAFGVYACSPEESSFTAVFSDFELSECKWHAHK